MGALSPKLDKELAASPFLNSGFPSPKPTCSSSPQHPWAAPERSRTDRLSTTKPSSQTHCQRDSLKRPLTVGNARQQQALQGRTQKRGQHTSVLGLHFSFVKGGGGAATGHRKSRPLEFSVSSLRHSGRAHGEGGCEGYEPTNHLF